jgi:hypothetical protein
MGMRRGRNAINGRLCKAYATIGGRVEYCGFMKVFDANIEKSKTEVPIMDDLWMHHKAGGLSGTFNATMYYISPIFRNMIQSFSTTKIDEYFTLTIINADPGSEAGTQTLTLSECNIDGVQPGKFDVTTDALEEDISGTFSGMDYISKFRED